MTTGQTLHDRLSLANKTTPQTVLALQAAIDQSWEVGFKLEEYATSVVTLATGTFVYSLNPTPALSPDLPPRAFYLNHDSNYPPLLYRGPLRLRWDHSEQKWKVTFDSGFVSGYTTKTLDILIQYPHPQITQLSETITLPPGWAHHFCRRWYAELGLSEARTDPRDRWQMIWESSERYLRDHLPLVPTISAAWALLPDELG